MVPLQRQENSSLMHLKVGFNPERADLQAALQLVWTQRSDAPASSRCQDFLASPLSEGLNKKSDSWRRGGFKQNLPKESSVQYLQFLLWGYLYTPGLDTCLLFHQIFMAKF